MREMLHILFPLGSPNIFVLCWNSRFSVSSKFSECIVSCGSQNLFPPGAPEMLVLCWNSRFSGCSRNFGSLVELWVVLFPPYLRLPKGPLQMYFICVRCFMFCFLSPSPCQWFLLFQDEPLADRATEMCISIFKSFLIRSNLYAQGCTFRLDSDLSCI